MKKILYHGFTESYLNTIDLLNKKYNWKPVVNIGKKETEVLIKKNFLI